MERGRGRRRKGEKKSSPPTAEGRGPRLLPPTAEGRGPRFPSFPLNLSFSLSPFFSLQTTNTSPGAPHARAGLVADVCDSGELERERGRVLICFQPCETKPPLTSFSLLSLKTQPKQTKTILATRALAPIWTAQLAALCLRYDAAGRRAALHFGKENREKFFFHFHLLVLLPLLTNSNLTTSLSTSLYPPLSIYLSQTLFPSARPSASRPWARLAAATGARRSVRRTEDENWDRFFFYRHFFLSLLTSVSLFFFSLLSSLLTTQATASTRG